MTADKTEYFAAFDDRDESTPWGLFKTEGAIASRYVPHRKAYVRLKDNWDFVAIGWSDDAKGTRPITEEQAKEYQDQVQEVDEGLVAELEIKTTSTSREARESGS